MSSKPWEVQSEFKVSLAKRFDDEALLASIAGENEEGINLDRVQEEAAKLIQTKHEDEILEMLGSNVPEGALDFLETRCAFPVASLPALVLSLQRTYRLLISLTN